MRKSFVTSALRFLGWMALSGLLLLGCQLGGSAFSSQADRAATSPEPTAETRSYADAMTDAHAGDRPTASGAIAQDPRQPVSGERVVYGQAGDRELTGYLSRPADATEPLPGLIVIHEWWGLNENIEQMADRLAGEGYAALAVDLYGGEVADAPDGARELMMAALGDRAAIRDNLVAAYDYLDGSLSAPKVGSIGWCLGGSMSLQAALALPDRLDATVIYYGGELVTDPAALEPLQMPILGLFGELDGRPSPETVREFQAALETAGKSPEIVIYPDANHAFANPSGDRYNPVAAEAAWEKTTAFLAEHLQ